MDQDSQHTSLHLARAREGDAESRSWLAEHLYPVVLAHAHLRLSPSDRAAGAATEVASFAMVTLLERLADLEPRAGRLAPVARSFLKQTLLQHIANRNRAGGRDRLRVGGEQAWWEDQGPQADSSSPSARARRGERSLQIEACLARMPAADREILILRFWEERPWTELVESLGAPEATLRKRGQRALDRLRELIPRELLEDFLADDR